MDIEPTQSISDDQELAKVLAGITGGADQAASGNSQSNDSSSGSNAENSNTNMGNLESEVAEPTLPDPIQLSEPNIPMPPTVPPMPGTTPASDELDAIKNDALSELRPLVDKLNVPAEEKFDTYLLIIRSTDDTSLIGPAHEAAKAIEDEARKAQALLDIIKEIDYFSNPQKQ